MLMTKSSKKPAAPAKTAAAKPAAKAKTAAPAVATKLGKTELTDMISDRAGITKRDAGVALSAVLDIMGEALRSGQTIGLPGVGALSVKATAARTGVKPGTAEKIQIPAGKKVSFKIATDLKKSL